MDVARQRRRLFVAMGFNAAAVVLALAAIAGAFAFRMSWLYWVFAAAIAAGFASHGWLMLGVMREKRAS